MFKTGTIRKIEVTDFVTYSHVVLYPGPKLNMLIGPNGTGKSTIVAAIILGLGGNPKTVGRGAKVSEYVRHNCDQATIHIHLQGDLEGDSIKITRVITMADKSSWLINNRRALAKEVIDCIRQFNIQVDNLCQFLPQDRVQDFAKLNQQQLLKETQVALCRGDLIEKQQTLIECRERQKALLQVIDRNGGKLQETRDANLRLEGKIENFSRKKKFLGRIEDIDRKVAWLEYDNLYERMVEVKGDLAKATEIYEKHKSEAKPMERQIQEAKRKVGDLQKANSEVTKSIHENESSCKKYLDKISTIKDKIRTVENDMNTKIALIEQKKQEIETMSSKIEEMKVAQRELVNKCGNDQAVQQKVQTITTEIHKLRRHITELENQKDELIATRQTKVSQLRAYENEKGRLENVKQKRLSHLRNVDNDAYEAVLWLRQNKHLFKEEVFEPIMLELNVLDPKNAVYVENVIPVRDRIAFTCTNKDDMNALIRYLRNERNLTVNIIYAGDSTNTRFVPDVPIEQLRKYGFYTYVHSLFTAPEPIMRYLCRTYRVHNIPVGTTQTNKYFQQLPPQINVFFSDVFKYSISHSQYTREKSVKQNEVHSDGGLSISLDVLHLERLDGQIQELKASFGTCDNQIKEYDVQIAMINDKIAKIADDLKYIQNVKRQAQAVEDRIGIMRQRLDEMRSSVSSVNTIRAQDGAKIGDLVRGIRPLVQALKDTCQSLPGLNVKSALNEVRIEKVRQDVAYLEGKNQEARRVLQESETTMNQVKEVYGNVKGQARIALQKAKNLSKDCTPDDEGFEEFRQRHESLPDDFRKLQEEKNQLQAKIECLNTADDEEMQEYEDRVRMIKDLQENIERDQISLDKMATRMEQLRQEWLEPLDQFIAQISRNFATAFERMGCAGEVSLNPGDDDREFANYGLSIKVTFRNGQPLQELNSVVQSGGERAVTTAVFMLALQELTPVPFRCVDEINQGMDATNERKIFDLLMESTGLDDTAQYFLVTPKLVPSLRYSDRVMVHIVHNGPFIANDKPWGMTKLCNPQRVLLN